MTDKDWKGNHKSIYTPLGASNHTAAERAENDYYATDPRAAILLMEVETFSPWVWECACGEGHLSEPFSEAGYHVFSSDLVNRGYGVVQDFLLSAAPPLPGFDIVTNPPYSKAADFVSHALDIIDDGHKVAMFLKLTFLEGKNRKELFRKYPPRTVYVSSSRLSCAKNGDFKQCRDGGAVAYAWYVWVKGYTSDTVVKWIN